MDYDQQQLLNEQLCHAAKSGTYEEVLELMDAGAEINSTDESGLGALHYAVQRDESRLTHALIDKGADVNLCNTEMDSDTPLAKAAEQGSLKIVKMLLKAGGDPYIRGARGLDALDHAESCEHQDKGKIIDIITRTVPPKKKRNMR